MAAKPETADTIEAECTACSDAQFKIRYDKRSENFPTASILRFIHRIVIASWRYWSVNLRST